MQEKRDIFDRMMGLPILNIFEPFYKKNKEILQYLNFLPDVIALMADDAMLVSDNIFHDGDVLESRYAVLRRDRTIHGRMREYLQVLCEKEELETICLPIADGMTISTKKRNGKGE